MGKYFKEASATERKETFPVSRFYQTYGSAGSFGASRAIQARALQGRKNIGAQPLGRDESDILKKIGPTGEKTYPISRFMTSPEVALTMGMLGSPVGAIVNTGRTTGRRMTTARAYKGRVEKDRTGVFPTDRKIIRDLKSGKKMDTVKGKKLSPTAKKYYQYRSDLLGGIDRSMAH